MFWWNDNYVISLNVSIEVIIADNFKMKIIVITNYDSIISADEIESSVNMMLRLKIHLMIWRNVFMCTFMRIRKRRQLKKRIKLQMKLQMHQILFQNSF